MRALLRVIFRRPVPARIEVTDSARTAEIEAAQRLHRVTQVTHT